MDYIYTKKSTMFVKTTVNGKPAAFNTDQIVAIAEIGNNRTQIRFSNSSFIEYNTTVAKVLEWLAAANSNGLESIEITGTN